jgi:FkbM family methyltransferase
MTLRSLHYQGTRLAISLGVGNPLIRSIMHLACRRHGAALKFSGNVVDVSKGNRVIRISAKHFVYAVDMARSFEEYFEPVVPAESNGSLLVDYSYPHLQQYAKGKLEFELSSFPEEEEAIDGYFRWYRPKAGDTVFDIGAYCGVSAYHFSKCVGPTGRVYAFEPDAISYSLLLRNIERHTLPNVVPLQIAIAGSEGIAQFCSEGTLGSSLSHQMSRATVGQIEQVPTISLQKACERYGVPSFAKIDIEGSEIEVLSSSRAFLRDHSIHFVLDTNHWIDGALTHSAVEALFTDCGYEAESSNEFGFMTTWARKR